MRQADINLGELAFQADAGDPDAQYRMAALFLLGESVEQDWNAAYLWMARAAAGEHRGAQALCEKLAVCRNVSSIQIDEKLGWVQTALHRARLFLHAALQVSTAVGHAARRSFGRLNESRARILVARIRFKPADDGADFPARRSEGFEYHEAS